MGREPDSVFFYRLVQALLTEIAREAVEALLPDNADGNLSSICLWADSIKRQDGYRWSAPLHYINTPNGACDYKYISNTFPPSMHESLMTVPFPGTHVHGPQNGSGDQQLKDNCPLSEESCQTTRATRGSQCQEFQ